MYITKSGSLYDSLNLQLVQMNILVIVVMGLPLPTTATLVRTTPLQLVSQAHGYNPTDNPNIYIYI